MRGGAELSGREHPLRATLFGDMPLADWAGGHGGEPWRHFAEAASRLGAGDRAAARTALERVLAMRGLESRHTLQAWDALRALGITPVDDEAKRVLGVVVDVPLDGGLDTLAAYEDGSARFLSHAGGAIIRERPDDALDGHVDALLDAGRALVPRIGPWDGPRPPLGDGNARLSLLTPSGLHFGEAPFGLLAQDPMAAPLVRAATALMQALVERTPH